MTSRKGRTLRSLCRSKLSALDRTIGRQRTLQTERYRLVTSSLVRPLLLWRSIAENGLAHIHLGWSRKVSATELTAGCKPGVAFEDAITAPTVFSVLWQRVHQSIRRVLSLCMRSTATESWPKTSTPTSRKAQRAAKKNFLSEPSSDPPEKVRRRHGGGKEWTVLWRQAPRAPVTLQCVLLAIMGGFHSERTTPPTTDHFGRNILPMAQARYLACDLSAAAWRS
jgi:hypothetical protein